MKILLAVDGSARSLKAVRYVIRHLSLFGKSPKILLLNLDPPMVERVAALISPEEIARYHEHNGRTALRGAKQALTKARIPHTARMLVGEPGGAIARTAKESHCNLIVMGSHGHAALQALVLGSVVTKVLAQTEIPVLIVR